MSRNIDVGLLRAFVAVAETGSVTRAAHLLNLTQAAVSQQLKRLEELFGVELFDRTNRTLRTTAAGERLLSHAQTMMTDERRAVGPDEQAALRGRGARRRPARCRRAQHPAGAASASTAPGRACRSRSRRGSRSISSPRSTAASSTSPWRPSATSPRMPSCCCAIRWSGSARAAGRRICASRCRSRSAAPTARSGLRPSRRWPPRGATGVRCAKPARSTRSRRRSTPTSPSRRCCCRRCRRV